MTAKKLRKGAAVRWSFGKGHADGKVEEVFTRRVRRTIEGARIVRNATPEKPAYLVAQSNGAHALKSHGELEAR